MIQCVYSLRKKEEEEKLGYEMWLAEREHEKLEKSPRHPSANKSHPNVPNSLPLLPVNQDGALRVYLRSLGKSKTGVNYEDWLNEKEMEINQLVKKLSAAE